MAIKEISTDLELIGHGAHHIENIKVINENFAELAGGSGETPSAVDWADVTGKPETFAPTIGTTSTTAGSGADVEQLKADLIALTARVVALETP